MKLAARSSLLTAIAVATAGSSTLLGAGAAFAGAPGSDPEACGAGTLIAPGVCEQVFTSTSDANGVQTPALFHRTDTMTHLEALLVGAGGPSAGYGSNGSAYQATAGGGGGQVKVTQIDATGDLQLTVADPSSSASMSRITSDGGEVAVAANGFAGFATFSGLVLDPELGFPTGPGGSIASGGSSGSGKPGAGQPANSSGAVPGAGGGGAGAAPAAQADGGAGVTVASVAPDGSLFADDTECFGGGGAGNGGLPGCNQPFGPVTANTGTGGSLAASSSTSSQPGASGLVVLRWTAAPAILTLVLPDGTTTTQSVVAGATPERPADPVKPGYTFAGWYSDEQLTTLAVFDDPLTAPTTFYAKFTAVPAAAPSPAVTPAAAAKPKPALAATGADATQTLLSGGLGAGALLVGGVLAMIARRRRTSR